MLASIVVCTYNRAELLAECLRELSAQSADASDYEVIIVDNNSTDRTASVAQSFVERHANYRYLMEPVQGLSHARNRGWQAARGQYVGYLDDDAKVSQAWLSVAFDVITRVAPGAFGGPYSAFYKTAKPPWYRDIYASHGHGDQAKALAYPETLTGLNVFFRRSLLERLGGFDPALGMHGAKIGYGEETHVVLRIHRMEPREVVFYDPSLHVQHLVPARKMTLRWIASQRFVSGRVYRQLYSSNPIPSDGRIRLIGRACRTIAGFCKDVLRALIHRDRGHYPYIQNFLCEKGFHRIHFLGMLYGQLMDDRLFHEIR